MQLAWFKPTRPLACLLTGPRWTRHGGHGKGPGVDWCPVHAWMRRLLAVTEHLLQRSCGTHGRSCGIHGKHGDNDGHKQPVAEL
jgi:hypothetical protein